MMNRRKFRFRVLAPALAAALLVPVFAGCGGGEEAEESSAETGGGAAGTVSRSDGESVAAMLAGDKPSMPLPTTLFRQISFEDHVYRFNPGVAGRDVVDRDMIAVERVRFGLPSDTSRVWTMAQMESLTSAGAIDQETRSFPLFSRALVRGDSADVARLLAGGNLAWYDVPRHERYPMRGVFQKFARRVEERYRERDVGGEGGHAGHDHGDH